MPDALTFVGLIASVFTALSYVPQVLKARPRGSTEDLSLKTLSVLTAGLILWISYGVMRDDWIIVAANSVGAVLAGLVLFYKIRDMLISES